MKIFVYLLCLYCTNIFAQDSIKIKVYKEFEISQNAEFPQGVNNFRKVSMSNISKLLQNKNIQLIGCYKCIVQVQVSEKGKIENVENIGASKEKICNIILEAIMLLNEVYTWKPALNKSGDVIKVKRIFVFHLSF